VGQVVRQAEQLGVPLKELRIEVYRAVHPAFDEDVYEVLGFARSVEARVVEGGTAPSAVAAQICSARELISNQLSGPTGIDYEQERR